MRFPLPTSIGVARLPSRSATSGRTPPASAVRPQLARRCRRGSASTRPSPAAAGRRAQHGRAVAARERQIGHRTDGQPPRACRRPPAWRRPSWRRDGSAAAVTASTSPSGVQPSTVVRSPHQVSRRAAPPPSTAVTYTSGEPSRLRRPRDAGAVGRDAGRRHRHAVGGEPVGAAPGDRRGPDVVLGDEDECVAVQMGVAQVAAGHGETVARHPDTLGTMDFVRRTLAPRARAGRRMRGARRASVGGRGPPAPRRCDGRRSWPAALHDV